MKIIDIEITIIAVMEAVAQSTAYAGVKCGDRAEFYDKVATVEEDENFLLKFFSETCGEIIDSLKEFLKTSVLNNEKLVLTLELSGAYDEALTPSVTEDIKKSIVAGIAGKWFQYTYPARALEWIENSNRLMVRARSKLCQRKRPVRGEA